MLSTKELKYLTPLEQADNHILSVLAEEGSIQHLNEGETLFQFGSVDDTKIYLLDGELQLTARDGRVRLVKTERQKPVSQAIASLVPRQYTVTAARHTKIVCFENERFEQILNGEDEHAQSADGVDELLDENVGVEGEIFTQIFIDITSETFSLPNLPEVATKALQLLREDETDANQLEAIIQGDPAIAAKLLKAANSALYGGHANINSISQAIVRIGMDTTTQMVMGFAMETLFLSDSQIIKQAMNKVWFNSVNVASIATVMAKKTKLFDPGQAMLAGLIHDIGKVAVLSYLDKNNYTISDKQIDKVLCTLRSEIGSMILTKWNFSKDFVKVVEGAYDWPRDQDPEADLCDLIMIAQLHANIQNPGIYNAPAMFELPAFTKLGLDEWSPETGLEMMSEAEQEVKDIVQMFIQ